MKPHIDEKTAQSAKAATDRAIAAASKVLLGKDTALRLALSCMLARGHLLIEDRPGVGKTVMAQLLAKIWGLEFQRIQFTSDLLPADVVGYTMYDKNSGEFEFHKGPIFAQLVLADEINRTPPKTQSALLEAMEEQQVSIEGRMFKLPQPFFVIATQNPFSQIGTFMLPESQLDRFTMSLALGFPEAGAERELLRGEDKRDHLQRMKPILDADTLQKLQSCVRMVTASDALLDYLQAIIRYSREQDKRNHGGLSPRAAILSLHCARAYALISGRTMVAPDDLQLVLPYAMAHRLFPDSDKSASGLNKVRELISKVDIP